MKSPMRYAIVIEKAGGNFSAYVPDLPGCVATGARIEDVERAARARDVRRICPPPSPCEPSMIRIAMPDHPFTHTT